MSKKSRSSPGKFVMLPEALDGLNLSFCAKQAWAHLWHKCGFTGACVYSVSEIAKLMECDNRVARRALHQLRSSGVIEVEERKGTKPIYVALWPTTEGLYANGKDGHFLYKKHGQEKCTKPLPNMSGVAERATPNSYIKAETCGRGPETLTPATPTKSVRPTPTKCVSAPLTQTAGVALPNVSGVTPLNGESHEEVSKNVENSQDSEVALPNVSVHPYQMCQCTPTIYASAPLPNVSVLNGGNVDEQCVSEPLRTLKNSKELFKNPEQPITEPSVLPQTDPKHDPLDITPTDGSPHPRDLLVDGVCWMEKRRIENAMDLDACLHTISLEAVAKHTDHGLPYVKDAVRKAYRKHLLETLKRNPRALPFPREIGLAAVSWIKAQDAQATAIPHEPVVVEDTPPKTAGQPEPCPTQDPKPHEKTAVPEPPKKRPSVWDYEPDTRPFIEPTQYYLKAGRNIYMDDPVDHYSPIHLACHDIDLDHILQDFPQYADLDLSRLLVAFEEWAGTLLRKKPERTIDHHEYATTFMRYIDQKTRTEKSRTFWLKKQKPHAQEA